VKSLRALYRGPRKTASNRPARVAKEEAGQDGEKNHTDREEKWKNVDNGKEPSSKKARSTRHEWKAVGGRRVR